MNKHSAIVILASLVIAGPFVFFAWNVYAAEDIVLSAADEEQFNFFDIVNDGNIAVCNPSSFYVSFDKIEIIMYFQGKDVGTYSSHGATIAPSSSWNVLEGNFKSESFEEAQYLAMHFDGMFGGSAPTRIDPSQFAIITEVQTSLMGFIPYSVSKQYSGIEFWEILNNNSIKENC